MTKSLLVPLAIFLFFITALAAAAFGRAVETRRRRRRRVVERPNSHHTWERVREIETRERWHDIPLERIHEVNRDEVVRLLTKISTWGSDTLRPQERRFLDQMAAIAGMGPPPESASERSARVHSDLRHRPA
jgi:hypothetical protein